MPPPCDSPAAAAAPPPYRAWPYSVQIDFPEQGPSEHVRTAEAYLHCAQLQVGDPRVVELYTPGELDDRRIGVMAMGSFAYPPSPLIHKFLAAMADPSPS